MTMNMDRLPIRAGYLLVAVILLLVLPALGSMSAPMNARDLTGTNMEGIDHWNTFVNSAQECADLCEQTSGCEGAVYVLPNTIQGPNGHCWRKSSVVKDIENFNCISFIKGPSGGGCSGAIPQVDFSANQVSGDAPLAVTFTALAPAAQEFEWDVTNSGSRFNPSLSDSEYNFVYNTPGVYSVRLKVREIKGSCKFENEMVKTNYIRVNAVTAGALSITSTPAGASVSVDGTSRGTTPVTLTGLSASTHTVRLSLQGYGDVTKTVTITAGGTNTLSVPLEKSSSATGALQVISTPDGAAITIDGGPQGTTPNTISGLAAGSHTIKVTKSGYTDYQTPVTVTGGKTTQLTVTLVSGNGPSPTVTTTKNTGSGTGSISVSSSPAGAAINLDGWDKGKTPATLDQVKAGSHTLTLSLAGYADKILTVPVDAGKVTAVTASLVPSGTPTPAGSGTLTVRSDPGGASVYFDGEKVGNTPVQLKGVPAGTHNLLLTMQGYSNVTRTIEMTADSDKELSLDLGKKAPGFALPLALAALGAVTFLMVRRGKQR
jgi:hypothetical protein